MVIQMGKKDMIKEKIIADADEEEFISEELEAKADDQLNEMNGDWN